MARAWSTLAPRTQRRYAAAGRSGGLTGRQEYTWENLTPRYRARYTSWASTRGLDPRRVYGDPELRPVAVGQAGRTFRGRVLVDPLAVVRRPYAFPDYVRGPAHQQLVMQVGRSPAGMRAFAAQVDDSHVPTDYYGDGTVAHIPAASVLPLEAHGITTDHTADKQGRNLSDVMAYLKGYGALVDAGIVYVVVNFTSFPYEIVWCNTP